ncbi:Ribosomal L28 family [Gossypium australe]|uniref:Large ribosomal subunit protein bL28c n=1 Tax=Gossypium australe TaxID=47621 RepID=A0A5B6WHW1_9ROSI|nr:Ribosomal L28 family [Gossypium australe]
MATLATLGTTSLLRFRKADPLKASHLHIFWVLSLLNSVASNSPATSLTWHLSNPYPHLSLLLSSLLLLCYPDFIFSKAPPSYTCRVCPFTGKKANKAKKISFSNHKTKKLQFVNLQYKKVWWEAGKLYVKLRLSTKALKTIEKNGLDAVAKKAGIDLRKE